MIHGLQKEVMPHVRFENKDYGRNEAASLKAGRHIPNHATFIIIHPHGSKDESEQIAEEWLPRKRTEASRGNYNLDWIEHFERQYTAWKSGQELPRQGSPIMTWQMISPEQQSRLRALGLTVVEDLAAIPDSGLSEIGLDARIMRDTARAWIAEGQQKGINAQELAYAKTEIERQKGVIASQEERLQILESKLLEEAPIKRGRPRRQEEEAA